MGDAQLCCAVYNGDKYRVSSYLDTLLEEIQKIKRTFSICQNCTRQGLHVYYTYAAPEFDDIARQRRQTVEKEKQ